MLLTLMFPVYTPEHRWVLLPNIPLSYGSLVSHLHACMQENSQNPATQLQMSVAVFSEVPVHKHQDPHSILDHCGGRRAKMQEHSSGTWLPGSTLTALCLHPCGPAFILFPSGQSLLDSSTTDLVVTKTPSGNQRWHSLLIGHTDLALDSKGLLRAISQLYNNLDAHSSVLWNLHLLPVTAHSWLCHQLTPSHGLIWVNTLVYSSFTHYESLSSFQH